MSGIKELNETAEAREAKRMLSLTLACAPASIVDELRTTLAMETFESVARATDGIRSLRRENEGCALGSLCLLTLFPELQSRTAEALFLGILALRAGKGVDRDKLIEVLKQAGLPDERIKQLTAGDAVATGSIASALTQYAAPALLAAAGIYRRDPAMLRAAGVMAATAYGVQHVPQLVGALDDYGNSSGGVVVVEDGE